MTTEKQPGSRTTEERLHRESVWKALGGLAASAAAAADIYFVAACWMQGRQELPLNVVGSVVSVGTVGAGVLFACQAYSRQRAIEAGLYQENQVRHNVSEPGE